MTYQIPKLYKALINVLIIFFHITTSEYYKTNPSIMNFKGMFELFSNSSETFTWNIGIFSLYLPVYGGFLKGRQIYRGSHPLPCWYCGGEI